jgi:CheY-like chemotaxis protein
VTGVTPALPQPFRLLIVEDFPEDADLLVRALQRAGYTVDWQRVEDEAEYLAALTQPVDLILCDYALPQFGALRALEILGEQQLDIPLIVITGAVGEEIAADCIKRGAADYLLKDRLTRLSAAVGQAVRQAGERGRLAEAETEARRLEGVKLAVREVAHLLNNDLALAVGTLELLLEDRGLSAGTQEGMQTALVACSAASEHLAKFQRVVRVETQDTPIGLALDVERSI